MAFGKDRHIGLFIDGSNLFETAKAVNLFIDYKKLLAYYRRKGNLMRAYYYTALPDRSVQSDLRPFIDWLDYNGYTIVQKPIRSFTNGDGEVSTKGNMDCELILDCVDIHSHLTDAILFSGDGDFTALCRWLQRRGVQVTVVSTIMSLPNPMVADELRRATDVFVDIAENAEDHYKTDLREFITREDNR